MKKEELFELLGDTEDDLIMEAKETKKRRKFPAGAVSAVAACVCLLAVGGAVWINHSGKPADSAGCLHIPTEQWVEVPAAENENETLPEDADIAVSKAWEDMTDAERYGEIAWGDDGNWMLGGALTDISLRGAALGETTVSGYDEAADITRQQTVTVYALTGIDETYAVCVRYPESETYATYYHCTAYPETLGDFVDALSLYDNLEFNGNAYFSYTDENGDFVSVSMTGLDGDLITDALKSMELSDVPFLPTDTPAVSGIHADLSCAVNFPLSGQYNVSFGFSAEGYLVTNLLGTQKTFAIGREAAGRFFALVFENTEGTKTTYHQTVSENNTVVTSEEGADSIAVVETTPAYNPQTDT